MPSTWHVSPANQVTGIKLWCWLDSVNPVLATYHTCNGGDY